VLEKDINDFNNEELKKFEEQVEKDTEEFFKSEDRKRKHLEKYDSLDFGPFWGMRVNDKGQIVKKINYNFLCIEKQPDLIDISFFDDCHNFLMDRTAELFDIAKKNIPFRIKKEI
jgi:predicted metalloprotease